MLSIKKTAKGRFEAVSNGETLGVITFVSNGDTMTVKRLEADDSGILDGLLRAAAASEAKAHIVLDCHVDAAFFEQAGLCEVFTGNIAKTNDLFSHKKCGG